MAKLQPKNTTKEEEVTIEETAPVKEEKPKAKTTKKSKLVKVIFDENDSTESDDLFIGLNGKHFQIQRGEEVVVPRELLNVVNESVYRKMKYDKDGNVYFKDVPRISYRILGDV